jgi:uncharacterized DUF497 family protein
MPHVSGSMSGATTRRIISFRKANGREERLYAKTFG